MKIFSLAIIIDVVLTLVLYLTEFLINFVNNTTPTVAEYIMFQLRMTMEFVASQTQLACVFLFFFKLKQVEIQIDIQSGTLQ